MDTLFAPEFHQYINTDTAHICVIYHENGHSLGPSAEYQNALGEFKHIIEEHKADVIAIACLSEIAKAYNMFDEKELKTIYTSWVFGSLLLRAEPVFANPHRVAELIQFNYLKEHGVIWLNNNQKINIDFDNVSSVMYRLLEETIDVQLSKSVSKAKDFITRWAYWGDDSKYIASIQQQLGIKPYIKIVTNF
jgi:hypothetical protein